MRCFELFFSIQNNTQRVLIQNSKTIMLGYHYYLDLSVALQLGISNA